MTNEHDLEASNSNDDIFVAEADEFDDDLDAALPRWPKVVGIISIVWGGIGVICNGIGAVSSLVTPSMMKGMADQMEGGMPPIVTDPPMINMVAAALGLLLSLFLVIAGVLTLLRKPAGRTTHLIYAPLHLVMIVWGVMIQLGVQSEIADWVSNNPDADFAKSQQMSGAIGMVIALVMTAVFLVWPVFCLVWFGLKKKTHEDMTGGVDLDTI
jgi:hypothetical protein